MRRTKQIVTAVIALVALGVGTLFYVQNAGTEVVLFLHLGFWTGQLSTPWPVPLLMLASFAAGLGLMGLYTLYLQLRRRPQRRIDERGAVRRGADDGYDDLDF